MFAKLWAELTPIGRAESGGYLRYALTEPETALRAWFRRQAGERDMPVTEDGNGNLFAWWGDPADGGGVLTGSHFDSVPHGGGYDGPLGIVSGFLAVDALRGRGVTPARPIGVAAFVEEEGGRFGVPCLGSRLLTGAIDPASAAALTDAGGVSFGEALGRLPTGPRDDLLKCLAAYIELHVEQGRQLVDVGAPVGVGEAIWPHGRWRFTFTGEGDHAGTTRMGDRRDPMLTYAFTVLAANKEARLRSAHATVGRVLAEPNATNAVPSRVTGWLDARAAHPDTLDELLGAVVRKAAERADRDGTVVTVSAESVSPVVVFDPGLAARLADVVGRATPAGTPDTHETPGPAPILPTGAGHDAGVLAGHVPTAMLFVRNPTGVSHSPTEHATDEDCERGVTALAAVLEDLSCA